MSIRSAASCGHPWHDKVEPRGARMTRVPIVMTRPLTRRRFAFAEDQNLKSVREDVNRIRKKSFS
jgi:hypothetical protein